MVQCGKFSQLYYILVFLHFGFITHWFAYTNEEQQIANVLGMYVYARFYYTLICLHERTAADCECTGNVRLCMHMYVSVCALPLSSSLSLTLSNIYRFLSLSLIFSLFLSNIHNRSLSPKCSLSLAFSLFCSHTLSLAHTHTQTHTYRHVTSAGMSNDQAIQNVAMWLH